MCWVIIVKNKLLKNMPCSFSDIRYSTEKRWKRRVTETRKKIDARKMPAKNVNILFFACALISSFNHRIISYSWNIYMASRKGIYKNENYNYISPQHITHFISELVLYKLQRNYVILQLLIIPPLSPLQPLLFLL